MPFDRQFVVNLYAEYHGRLRSLDRFEPERPRIGLMYHGEERRILYMMIAHLQPEVVVEMSPNQGWSTLHIAQALEDNGLGVVHSFEIDPENAAHTMAVVQRYGLNHRVHVHPGDAKATLPPVLQSLGLIDCLFVDSDHSYAFGRWWLRELLPAVRPGGLVHVHDVEYSHRYGWDALTNTHHGKGEYGPPPRRFVAPGVIWRQLWRRRWLPRSLRRRLLPRAVHDAFVYPYYRAGVSVGNLQSPAGPGEALALKQYLDKQKGEVEWLSVMALAEDPTYREAVAPYGGGQVASTPDPWGYERSPSIWIRKLR